MSVFKMSWILRTLLFETSAVHMVDDISHSKKKVIAENQGRVIAENQGSWKTNRYYYTSCKALLKAESLCQCDGGIDYYLLLRQE